MRAIQPLSAQGSSCRRFGKPVGEHNQQKLTARDGAHAYPVLAALSSLSLLSITNPASRQNPSLQPLHR